MNGITLEWYLLAHGLRLRVSRAGGVYYARRAGLRWRKRLGATLAEAKRAVKRMAEGYGDWTSHGTFSS